MKRAKDIISEQKIKILDVDEFALPTRNNRVCSLFTLKPADAFVVWAIFSELGLKATIVPVPMAFGTLSVGVIENAQTSNAEN